MMERFKALLRGDVERFAEWLTAPDMRSVVGYIAIILIGSGLYGFTLGIWRAPSAVALYRDQVSAPDLSHLRRQLRA